MLLSPCTMAIYGECLPQFAKVRQAFSDNFALRGELGASFCLWHENQKVVDLWGGYQHLSKSEPWQEDSMGILFSATKGITALCFLLLEDQGGFSYDEPVAAYWPEFGVQGKGEITIRTLLNHRAGLTTIPLPVSIEDLQHNMERVHSMLASQAPLWPANQDQGYHAITYGIYAAELFRRITQKSLGSFLQEHIASPLGVDVYLGLPSELEPRVVEVFPPSIKDYVLGVLPKAICDRGMDGRIYRQILLQRESGVVFGNPSELGLKHLYNFNRPDVHALELAWSTGIASARGLARVYAMLANGGELEGQRFVKEVSLEPLKVRQSWSSQDRVLRKPVGWSQGFLKEEKILFSPNSESFGHSGAGGALGWCDPVAKIAMAYIPNKMSYHLRSPRAQSLSNAVYQSLV